MSYHRTPINLKKMKYLLLFVAIAVTNLTLGQSNLPDFLEGTWKMKDKETYEHWDKLNEQMLKGISYKLKNGKMHVAEYLEITQKGNAILYTATVVNQNQGEGIAFKLIQTDSSFSFENPSHDFPKKIVYQKLSETEILVQVSDENQKDLSYTMTKQSTKRSKSDTANPDFDEALADKLGGDDYGMKRYFFVILKTGANMTTDKELINESFRGHLDNITRLVDEGKLIVAGPLGKNENNYRGIFILNNINAIEEAKELLTSDPAVKNGLLDYDIFTWYGSAALPEYLPFSDKIWKLKP